jgi:hypothetical protein
MAHRATMRTINATTAVRRAGRFVSQLQNMEKELGVLCDARNGIAHLAHAGQDSDLLAPFLKGCELLRDALGVNRDTYWGEFVSVVDEALQASVDEARLRVANALGSARVEFEKRYAHLDADARDGVIHAIEAGYAPDQYEERIVQCPACGSPSLISGAVETRWEQETKTQLLFWVPSSPATCAAGCAILSSTEMTSYALAGSTSSGKSTSIQSTFMSRTGKTGVELGQRLPPLRQP